MSSVVLVTYNNTSNVDVDITNDVLFQDARFEAQMNAVPGTFSFRVKDPDQTYDFVTGREVRVFVDDVPMFGGYILRATMHYPFEADNTFNPATYEKRIWQLEGSDYNLLFDTRFIRRTSNYTGHVPNATGYAVDMMDGEALRTLLSTFCDFPSGFDITTEIDDINTVLPEDTDQTGYRYKQQGTKIRDQFAETAAWRSGAVFYIGADKKVHYHAYENVKKHWGFSDSPNYNSITGGAGDFDIDGEAIAKWGFREVTGVEDGSMIVNDVMVWGGGAPVGDKVRFARYQDTVGTVTTTSTTYVESGTVTPGSSIDLHGRWQHGETRFNDLKTLRSVKTRAEVIIDGPPGSDAYGQQKGLRLPQWTFEFNWYAHKVPTLGGDPNHIVAGDIVNITLGVFGVSEFMPCRTLRISFPTLDETGKAVVLFSGEFGMQYTDPVALWSAILKSKPTTAINTTIAVTDDSESTAYGDIFNGEPYETPNGSRTLFSLRLSNGIAIGYITNTLILYINGLAQRRGTDYTESDPATGEFTISTAPSGTDTLFVNCRTLENG
jgi:hypothetical protein